MSSEESTHEDEEEKIYFMTLKEFTNHLIEKGWKKTKHGWRCTDHTKEEE